MCDSFFSKGKKLLENRILTKNVQFIIKNNKIILASILVVFLGLVPRIWNMQATLYAHAYTSNNTENTEKIDSPLFDKQPNLFVVEDNKNKLSASKKNKSHSLVNKDFASKLHAIVGDSPIKEMVPFISKRDKKVAAFLIGIAKKESSFGEHSPSQGGQDCYNYWGYKGSAGNGSVKGYACFSSAEEAVEIVGNRIEVLVGKNRNTPASMVNTWKCGTSCKGDPGAPSWVSTVALYFNKIVG